MPKITVATPFTYTDPAGAAHKFATGVHTVDADVAAHWFVKAHLVADPKVEAKAPKQSDAEKLAAQMLEASAIAVQQLKDSK